MARLVADQNKVLFITESGTYGNTSGTGQWLGLVKNHEITDNENYQVVRYAGTASRNLGSQYPTALDHEGTITFHPQDWKSLVFALGSCVDAGSPSPYTHVISEADSNDGNAYTSGTSNPFMSFTVEDSQASSVTGGNLVRTLKGCTTNSWELSAGQGEIAEVTVGYIAQSDTYSSGATTAVTAANTRPLMWQDVTVHIPSGTVYNEVTNVTLSINNNLNAPHYLNGSRVIAAPIPENRDHEISLGLHGTTERTKTLYDQYFRGGSTFNMMVQVTDTVAGAGSRDAFFIYSGCSLIEMSAPTASEGVNEQEITIRPTNLVVNINDLNQYYNPW